MNETENVLSCSQSPVPHRFDVTMQEANRVDALYGFQDLTPQPQGGADAEGAPGHTPPQVGQVPTLRDHIQIKICHLDCLVFSLLQHRIYRKIFIQNKNKQANIEKKAAPVVSK